jgi:altronate hydrolase
VAPVIKVASNSLLADRMHDIIDFDTGSIIQGTKTIAETGDELLQFIIEVASGRVVPKAVSLDQEDFIPWKRGVSL